MAKYSTLFYFFLVLHQIINIDCCNITWAKNRACHLIFLLLLLKCIQQLLESTYVNCTEIRELPLLRINALPRTTFATTRKRTSVRTARVAGHYPLTPQSLLTFLYCVPSRHRFRWASVRMAGSSPKSSSPGTVSSSIS